MNLAQSILDTVRRPDRTVVIAWPDSNYVHRVSMNVFSQAGFQANPSVSLQLVFGRSLDAR